MADGWSKASLRYAEEFMDKQFIRIPPKHPLTVLHDTARLLDDLAKLHPTPEYVKGYAKAYDALRRKFISYTVGGNHARRTERRKGKRMGNWRTVRIEGSCAPEHVSGLIKALKSPELDDPLDSPVWRDHIEGPLSLAEGLCGFGCWPAEKISAIGNCYERGYSVEDIAEHLKMLVGLAPSLQVKIHCGGDYEDTKCVATVMLINHHVSIQKPEIEDVGKIPEEQIHRNLLKAIARKGKS